MPVMYPMTVKVAVEEVDKLDRLAVKTHRTRADLVRLLVSMAIETGMPDVTLRTVED